MGKAKKKFYNPYPFVIRVVNDLGKTQILAPQAHCKIFKDAPDRMAITLLPKSKQREYRDSLGLELEELTKVRLISIAWTVLVDESEETLEKLTKKQIIALIEQKTGEEEKTEEAVPRQDIEILGKEEADIDDEEMADMEDAEEEEEPE